MEFNFKNLQFGIKDGKIRLCRLGEFSFEGGTLFAEVQVSGENKDTHMGVKMANSSEGRALDYLSHTQTENTLEIVQRSALVEVKTIFTAYDDTQAVRVCTEVKNISGEELVLEEVSAFIFTGLGVRGIDSADKLYFTRFLQSHHAECQPRRLSFKEWGLFRGNTQGQKRIAFANIGSWSTKEELPQGIIEDTESGKTLMFQIESSASWYYEIADVEEKYYLYLGGPNLPFGGWSKALKQNESYRTPFVALSFGKGVEEAVADMTKYRRHIAGKNALDAYLPAIFNEYMHLSWDSPSEASTKKVSPTAAKTGVKYYVIDCGWHNEEKGSEIYSYVGQWKESKARFPSGIRKMTDFIRSLGMKAGLWIEPEVIGIKCQEMLDYYDDGCFMQRNGKKISVMNRYFLDYRNEKVRSYMSETIRRMVEEYGADYIKFDYNQDCGVGTDYRSFCAGEGLEACADAFYEWAKEMTRAFPQVIFEGCSSGGMRMDYKTLSAYPLISTSDQIDYLKYPYIAANVLSAVIPEQAAVWSYPVAAGKPGLPLDKKYDEKWVEKNITNERIIMNMINSFLGRMHLASHLELLSEKQFSLITEGVEYYNALTVAKKRAVPYMPMGFTQFYDDLAVSGLETEDKLYLAVWNLKEGGRCVTIPLKREVLDGNIAYPKSAKTKFKIKKDTLTVRFENGLSARFFEITKKN